MQCTLLIIAVHISLGIILKWLQFVNTFFPENFPFSRFFPQFSQYSNRCSMWFVIFQQLFQQTPCFRQRKLVTKFPFLEQAAPANG